MRDQIILPLIHDIGNRNGNATRGSGLLLSLLVSLAISITTTPASAADATTGNLIHVRLKDRLDRPVDGYQNWGSGLSKSHARW